MKSNISKTFLYICSLVVLLLISSVLPVFADNEPVTVGYYDASNIQVTFSPPPDQLTGGCGNFAALVRIHTGIYPNDSGYNFFGVNNISQNEGSCTMTISGNNSGILPSDPLWLGYGNNQIYHTATFNENNDFVLPTATPTPTPTNIPTPTPTPAVQIVVNPYTANVTVGLPYTVDVKVNSGGLAFNAAQATVTVSSNLTVTGIKSPSSNSCNFDFTQAPTTSNPSFAGGIYGISSTGCTAYTMVLTPTSSGTGTITFTNVSIKSYSDSSEILTGVQNGSFTINAIPTPTGTALQTIDDSLLGTGQNQWNYNGSGWGHCTSCDETNPTVSFYNSSQSWDNVANDYVTIQFTGVQFRLYGATDPRDGIGAISIDSGAETNVDFYSVIRTGNVLLWTSPILSNSTHTLKLRVTGTHDSNATDNYIVLDRGDILSAITLSNLSVDTYPTDTYNSALTITGIKDSTITTVYINGSNSNVTYPTNTTWQAQISISQLGSNNYIIYGTDLGNNQTASLSINIDKHTLGDINGDGAVDLIDASLFAVDFGKTSNLTYPLSDMNGDGKADLTDLSILAKLEQ